MPQDMPPTGGYGPVQYKRNIPARGFGMGTTLLALGAVMTYGFWQLAVGARELRELQREKTWSRLFLVPALQAENDRDYLRRHLADQDRERDLLGEVTKPYHSDRFVRPHYTVMPAKPGQL